MRVEGKKKERGEEKKKKRIKNAENEEVGLGFRVSEVKTKRWV